MKQLVQLIHSKLKTWYYYQELKESSLAILAVAALWFLYNYGTSLVKWALLREGAIWCAYFMIGVITALVIKIYFRILVIKYHEKDTAIELFKEIESTK